MKEVEINLIGLFSYVLRKWKSILASMIVLSALFLGLDAMKTPATVETPEEDDSTQTISLVYMVSTDTPESLSGVFNAYILSLRNSKAIEDISKSIGLESADAKRYMVFDDGEGNASSTMACFSICVSDIPEMDFEWAENLIITTVDDVTRDLMNSGYSHKIELIRRDSFLSISETDINTVVDNQSEDENSNNAFHLSKKMTLLGAVIGLFASVFVHVVIYIFSNKLDDSDDVDSLFGTYLFGNITGVESKKIWYKLKKIGKRKFEYEESIDLVVSKIKMYASQERISKIGIVGCGIMKYSKESYNKLSEKLKKYGVYTTLIDDVLYNSESVQELSGVDSAILLEKSGMTYRTEICKELEMLKSYGVKTLGLIISE